MLDNAGLATRLHRVCHHLSQKDKMLDATENGKLLRCGLDLEIAFRQLNVFILSMRIKYGHAVDAELDELLKPHGLTVQDICDYPHNAQD